MKLEMVRIEKKYGKVHALKGISFAFEEGIYGLLGPNGSGKSTLMNIITSNIPATSGQALWNGCEIRKLGKDYRTILGYVPQQQALYSDFTVIDFMQYAAALREAPEKEAGERIDSILERVELSEVKHYKIKMLSGGMKQRLLIAQALLGKPQLLVMDEPTVGLDPRQRKQICDLIRMISKKRIVILATHIVSDLDSFADCVLLLKKGELIGSGTPGELIRETEQHTGSSKITLDDVYLHYFGE